MKVFLVTRTEGSGYCDERTSVAKVFATKEKANEYVLSRCTKQMTCTGWIHSPFCPADDYSVDEYEVEE